MENFGRLDGLREENNGHLTSTSQAVYERTVRSRERFLHPHGAPGNGSYGQPRLYFVMHCPRCCRNDDEKKWSQIKWMLSRPSVPDKL